MLNRANPPPLKGTFSALCQVGRENNNPSVFPQKLKTTKFSKIENWEKL